MPAPSAAGVRVAWADVPAEVRSAVEGACGSPVVTARTQPGGFSPGVAVRVRCENQARFFIKAASSEANPVTPRLHRQEGEVLAALDPVIAARRLPIPRLHAAVEHDPWVALVIEDVEGHHPAQPWRRGDLQRVVAALDRLSAALTPSPVAVPPVSDYFAGDFTGWRTLAGSVLQDGLDPWFREHLDALADLEATWPEHAAGDTLLHADIRADNLLLTTDGVMVVDWPHACRGAAVTDLVFFAPSVAMQGGPDLPALLAMSASARAADPRSVAAVVCAVAGYFTLRALQPPPPGLPTVRAFQSAQGQIARTWLTALL